MPPALSMPFFSIKIVPFVSNQRPQSLWILTLIITMTELKEGDVWEENMVAEKAAVVASEDDVESGGDEEERFKDSEEGATEGGVGNSLVWKSRTGDYEFAPNPYRQSVCVLLFLRFVERAAYYGYVLLSPGFLTGKIDLVQFAKQLLFICTTKS